MKHLATETALALLIALSCANTFASEALEAQKLVDRSTAVFDRFVADKNFTIFRENLGKAKAVLIFPEVLKAGFFWGGSGGGRHAGHESGGR
jgi:lipid-binding SYLF domain-containing protein